MQFVQFYRVKPHLRYGLCIPGGVKTFHLVLFTANKTFQNTLIHANFIGKEVKERN